MTNKEVIIVKGIEDRVYHNIVSRALMYGAVSLSFTYNRMGVKSPEKKIVNIAKGKIAEGLLFRFSEANRLYLDFTTSATPFYTKDQNDFLFDGYEWDIKNNFVYHAGQIMPSSYLELPALVPDNNKYSQWQRRDELYRKDKRGHKYLFSFMKNADELNRRKQFVSLYLTSKQNSMLQKLYEQFQGRIREDEPFKEEMFFEKFGKIEFELHHKPHLILTGYAGTAQWPLFTTPQKKETRIYGQNALRTVIANAQVPIYKLPAFSNLFPKLKAEIKLGEWMES